MACRGGHVHLTVTTSAPIFRPFIIFYVIMLLHYIRRAVRSLTQVFIGLSLFCAIRVIAFVIYAALTAHDHVDVERSNPRDSGQAITLSVFLSVGFFALLYSAYVLVLDREIASGSVVKNSISRVTSNRYLICFALTFAVAIGIATYVCPPKKNMIASALQKTYVIIFLAVTVLMGVQTVFQVNAERAALKRGMPATPSRRVYHKYIPCLILILLLIREIYFIVSIHAFYIYREVLWWTLGALPELLAVCLFAIPDLVPEKIGLAPHAHGQESEERI